MNRLHTISEIKSYNDGVLIFNKPLNCKIGERVLLTDHKNSSLAGCIIRIESETKVAIEIKREGKPSVYETAVIHHF